MYIGRPEKMTGRTNRPILTASAGKRLAMLSLAMLLFGCDSGDSGGDVTGRNQTDITEVGMNTAATDLLVDQPALSWAACENHIGLECASLLVPLDYSNPEGKSISIAMARRPANQTTGSRTLFTNPGGPGFGGIQSLEFMLRFDSVSTSVKDAFNFVSFDPRGTGASDSVSCSLDNFADLPPYPINRTQIELVFNATVKFSQDCANDQRDVVKHMGSNNVVRDVDEMRKALGLGQIDFLGFSYGTRLAALYMQSYPEYVGRFVLDGSMSPAPSVKVLVSGSILPGQANINRLANACIETVVLCDPNEFVTDLRLRMEALITTEPLSNETSLLYRILRFAFINPGNEERIIRPLSLYLETQLVIQLEYLYSIELGLGNVNKEIDEASENFVTAYAAILCADDPVRPTVDSLEALRVEFNNLSDLLAEHRMINAAICAGWPESADPMLPIATNQAPVSLVIGGTSDAQTPLVHAQQMAAAVGGQFLLSEHNGHGTVFTSKNSCTNAAAEAFLLTGNLPATSVCEADVPAITDAPSWRDDAHGWRRSVLHL